MAANTTTSSMLTISFILQNVLVWNMSSSCLHSLTYGISTFVQVLIPHVVYTRLDCCSLQHELPAIQALVIVYIASPLALLYNHSNILLYKLYKHRGTCTGNCSAAVVVVGWVSQSMWIVEHTSPNYNLFLAELTKSALYATCAPFLCCINFIPSVAVERCKMRGWFVVMVLIAMLIFQGTAQLTCKLWGPLLPQWDCAEQPISVLQERNKHPCTQEIAVSSPSSTHTHTHTHTHTQHVVRPDFHLNQYQANEGASVVIRLSARVLTTLPFNGSIEVDITAEDLPRKNAEFGKCHPSILHLLQLCVSS